MNPTKTRRSLPRFEGGSRHRTELYAAALPPRLLDAMDAAGIAEVRRHRELAAHFEKAREKAVAIAARFAQEKRDDEKRRADALSSGKPRPAPKAEKIELELRQAREDVNTLAELVRSSADELLVASAPFVADAFREAERDATAAVEEVARLLEALRAAVEEADARAGEHGWLGGLSRTGVAWPWSDQTRANSLPNVKRAIGLALGGFEEDRIRRDESRDARKREEEHAETLKLPPGTQVFREGREYVATEDGLEEVPR
jgi:hypothetical protein